MIFDDESYGIEVIFQLWSVYNGDRENFDRKMSKFDENNQFRDVSGAKFYSQRCADAQC